MMSMSHLPGINVVVFILLSCANYMRSEASTKECQCWITRSDRAPCEAGATLSESKCREKGCCFLQEKMKDGSGNDVVTSTCYTPRRECHKLLQCHIKLEKRKPCRKVHHSAGEKLCMFRGCCFDEAYTPSCYNALSLHDGSNYNSYHRHTPPPPLTVSSRPDPTIETSLSHEPGSIRDIMGVQMEYIEESVAVRSRIAVVGDNEHVLVHCPFNDSFSQCGLKGISKKECVARMCCWNPKQNSECACIYPRITKLMNSAANASLLPPTDEELKKYQDQAKLTEEEIHKHHEMIGESKFGIFRKTCRNKKQELCHSEASDRSTCEANLCCWEDANESCYESSIIQLGESESTFTTASPKETYQNRNSNVDFAEPFISFSPVNEITYDEFSIMIACPKTEEDTEICADNVNSEQCLLLFCCWITNSAVDTENGACYKSKVEYVETLLHNESLISEQRKTAVLQNPTFWVPSLPKQAVPFKNLTTLTSECLISSKRLRSEESLKCDGRNILTRHECIENGCCWRPWMLLESENASPCEAPSLREKKEGTIVDPIPNIMDGLGSFAHWSQWSSWSVCVPMAGCNGSGTRARYRSCAFTEAMQISKAIPICTGLATEEAFCQNGRDCKSSPEWWSEWTDWSECSHSCEVGSTVRKRFCRPPSYCLPLSLDAVDTQIETANCNIRMCYVWGPWEKVNGCDAGCSSDGNETETRTCHSFLRESKDVVDKVRLKSSDIVRDDGASLTSSSHAMECYVRTSRCVNKTSCLYHWDLWENWSSCDTECIPGARKRSRKCEQITLTGGKVVVSPEICAVALGGQSGEIGMCGTGRCLKWGRWRDVGKCNAKCGQIGIVEERRLCKTDYIKSAQPEHCYKRKYSCRGPECLRHHWGNWGLWSSCTGNCSPGNSTRTRKCYDSNAEVTHDRACVGKAKQVRVCHIDFCKHWGNWSEGECDSRCGRIGVKMALRFCLDPSKSVKSILVMPKECHTRSQICTKKCEVEWGEWGDWSKCSNDCSPGTRKRSRLCYLESRSIRSPHFCPGQVVGRLQEEKCNIHMCKAWSKWTRGECYGGCKIPGTTNLTRFCLDEGNSTLLSSRLPHEDICFSKTIPCKLKCARWGRWSSFGNCSNECSRGIKMRRRLCMRGSKIVPYGDCKTIRGKVIEKKDCNILLCSSYGPWKDDDFCNGTCEEGIGMRFRRRDCYSGKSSSHCLVSTTSCQTACGLRWGPWNEWSTCSERCGPGNRTRTRECWNRGEKVDPSKCHWKITGKSLSEPLDVEKCNKNHCRSWAPWENSICPAECNATGIMRRRRLCLDNAPGIFVPAECWTSIYTCTGKCIPRWMKWTAWTSCRTACGPGRQTSVRRCLENGIIVNPTRCSKRIRPVTVRYRLCNTNMCDSWSDWALGPCAVQCGGAGLAIKQRICTGKGEITPSSQPTNSNCYRREQICGTNPCPPYYNAWSVWSECSSICSPGKQRRTRKCVSGGFQSAGCSSLGLSMEIRGCNTGMCPTWRPWISVSSCSQSGGVRKRRRDCEQIMPQTTMRLIHPKECYEGIFSCT